MDDIQVTISERVLQHALSAYAAERFTFQRFSYPGLGLSAVGGDMRLELGQGRAIVSLVVHGAFRIKMGRWQVSERRETLTLRLGADFTVMDGELYVRVDEGDIEAREFAWIEKAGSEALRRLVSQVFQHPLVRLPVKLDVAASHVESTDESRLILSNVSVTPGALRLALSLVHGTVERPLDYATPAAPFQSRSRAIMLCRRGIEEWKAGLRPQAAALFYEAAFRADPSFETAWLWLAASVTSDGERRYCLERAIGIAPENTVARAARERLAHISPCVPLADAYPVRP